MAIGQAEQVRSSLVSRLRSESRREGDQPERNEGAPRACYQRPANPVVLKLFERDRPFSVVVATMSASLDLDSQAASCALRDLEH